MLKFIPSRLRARLFHGFFLMTRPMTLGVRVAAFDADGRLFLVRHSYVPGWHFPGGGIDNGETAAQAVEKELDEEGNLRLSAAPSLVSVHFNHQASRRDHVLFYRCHGVVQERAKQSDREISEARFFALSDLPQDTTQATLRRLRELQGDAAISEYW